MDLKQEVSLSALKRGKAPAYPVKTSINLVDTQQQRGNLLAQLGLFAIALVLIGVFAKFAVVDPLAASAASRRGSISWQWKPSGTARKRSCAARCSLQTAK